MRLTPFIGALACLGLASAAAAADLGGSLKDGPILAAHPNWSGLYIGGHVGWATGEWDGEACTSGNCPGNIWDDPDVEADFDGFLGGLQAGWNRQTGSIVWGLEADVSWGDLSGKTHLDTIPGKGGKFVRWHDEISVDVFGTVRGRVGVLVTPQFLLYGTGGLAWAKTELSHVSEHHEPNNNTKTSAITGRGDADEVHLGWVAGLGGEYMLASNWTVRAEWLHVDLGEAHYHADGTKYDYYSGEPTSPFKTDQLNDVDLKFDVFRLGVNYKFGN